MRRPIRLSIVGMLAVLALDAGAALPAADIVQFPFEVREAAGIRRRNDVITLRTTKAEIVGHQGAVTIRYDGKPIAAQVRRVEWPGEPAEMVVDFVDHFRPFETREYALWMNQVKD
jgi:hypothetical protein